MIMSNGSTDAVSGLCNSVDMYRFQGSNPTPHIPPVVAISPSVQNFFSHSVGDSYLIASQPSLPRIALVCVTSAGGYWRKYSSGR